MVLSVRLRRPAAGTDELREALFAAADRLHATAADAGLVVIPRRVFHGLRSVEEGLSFGNNDVDGWEAVRRRRLPSGTWHTTRSVEDAAGAVARFLLERPDLAG